jgi:archaellum biogenesis protein FlaJ (TadC family)
VIEKSVFINHQSPIAQDIANNPSAMLFPRPPKFLIPLTLYLIAFILILLLVVDYYLLPAADAIKHATPKEKHGLAAYSELLLAITLFILFVGLLLTFRIRRYFLPRKRDLATKTKYVDAWAESAKRMKTPPADST